MSIFGYPARVTHFQASIDNWGMVTGYTPEEKRARVIEEQKMIKNGKGEEVQSMAEIHLEGPHQLTMQDYFEYMNELGDKIRFNVLHIKSIKFLGTDRIKKVVVYA